MMRAVAGRAFVALGVAVGFGTAALAQNRSQPSSVTAFNLVCQGKRTENTLDELLKWKLGQQYSYQAEFRIDLAAGRWCRDLCVTSAPIQRVTENKIILEAHDSDQGDLLDDSYTVLDRETGGMEQRVRILRNITVWIGNCEKAPFTGLPARKF